MIFKINFLILLMEIDFCVRLGDILQKIYIMTLKERFVGRVGPDVKAFHLSGQALFGD